MLAGVGIGLANQGKTTYQIKLAILVIDKLFAESSGITYV